MEGKNELNYSIKNELNYKGKKYDLDDMANITHNLEATQEIYCNFVARYLWLNNQVSGGVNVKKSLKELFRLLKKDVLDMYKNIDDNYSFIGGDDNGN